MRTKKLTAEERAGWMKRVVISPTTLERIRLMNESGQMPVAPAPKKATTKKEGKK